MSDKPQRSIDIESGHDAKGNIEFARIRFGPHYFVEVRKDRESVSFDVGYTHHGFRADASYVDGELERIIEEVRRAHPDATVD